MSLRRVIPFETLLEDVMRLPEGGSTLWRSQERELFVSKAEPCPTQRVQHPFPHLATKFELRECWLSLTQKGILDHSS
jgi:hypothetical protein